MSGSRNEWPTFIFISQTTYRVAAPSVERALAWFTSPNDTDLDVITVDFGRIQVVDQVGATEA